MNKIFIENYAVISKHGYYKEEHFKPQKFIVSVWCDVSENSSGESDDLQQTFNYEEIRNVVKKIILGSHQKLLEKLANDMVQLLLKFKIVERVEVKITKPDIWGDCEPGVWVSKVRQV